MGAENSPGIQNFSGENLSRSFGLEEKFRRGGAIGGKQDKESRVRANVEVSRILNTSFSVGNVAETQIDAITNYDSVPHMIEIVNNAALTDRVRENAKNALYEVGLALSQNKGVFEAATKGEEELKKILPSNLYEIQPYILSSYLTNGKGDKEGQELVGEMMELFKLKRRADENPGYYQTDFEEKAKDLFTKILDKRDDASPEDEKNGNVGRWETMMGYIKGADDRTGRRPVVTDDGDRRSRRREELPEEAIRGGKKEESEEGDDLSRKEGSTRSWELDPSHMADAMKFMAGDMRWSDWTPPEWFKKLEKENPEEAYRISVMVMMNEVAAGVNYAGKNLDKIVGNDGIFAFTHEHMSKLFNEDFKMVMSKMLHDLCEPADVDQNGRVCLRYKEVVKRDSKGREYRTIDDKVWQNIRHIKHYEDELAKFLAERNGRGEPNYMDRMNAYTAWNMFYGFGDSSVADRMRILPTITGVVNDAIRTLNPEYKALAKWQILKSGQLKEDDSLFDAEYFSGPLADYVLMIMKIERDLGRPIDGKETLRDKIIRGKMPLLANKTFYGFLDFVHGGRDLFKGGYIKPEDDPMGDREEKFYDRKTGSNEKVTLAGLLMDYGRYDGSGKFIKNGSGREFNFGNETNTFMNEFRDMMEAAILVYNCTTGKAEVKDPAVWARTLKDKLGMVNGIEINGTRALSYSKDPELWRDCIIGTFGADMDRLSSDYVRLKVDVPKGATAPPAYNLYVNNFFTKVLRLSGNDVNLNEVMRKLGVSLGKGESPEGFVATVRNGAQWVADGTRTRNLINRQSNSYDRDLSRRPSDIQLIIDGFKGINEKSLDSQTAIIYRNLGRAINSNDAEVMKRLWEELKKRV